MHKKHPFYYLIFCLLSVFLTSCGIKKSINNRPDISIYNTEIPERVKVNDSSFYIGNSFLKRNKQGLWELYVEGNPLEIGLISGNLTQEIIYRQEAVFIDRINDLVPSVGRQKFLKRFLSWYNRKMFKHVSEEYKTEIYGISRYMSEDHNNLATPYLRALYLHGAHDIGHALNDLALVGCTSFAVWNEKTQDGQLLLGRNFDFYAGDEFAEDKVVSFINPHNGHKFMSISWSGFIGVVSGMNEKGLTVTINAGKSKIPWAAKTPISLVAREILQYAATIEEAIAIAKKKKVFVSEAIMIGSAIDRKAVILEISPQKFDVYEVENTNELICSNHFQSEAYKKDRRNSKTIQNSHSLYRYERMSQVLEQKNQITPEKAAWILRNKEGLDGTALGYGNEKALNQLLAHHGIIFKPEELKVWISANPYQLGEFVAYDLHEIFNNAQEKRTETTLSSEALTIAKDPFMETEAYKNYETYRILERRVSNVVEQKELLSNEELYMLIQLNPHYWKAYYLKGLYYYKHKDYEMALTNFQLASEKEITTRPEAKKLQKYIKKSKRKRS